MDALTTSGEGGRDAELGLGRKAEDTRIFPVPDEH